MFVIETDDDGVTSGQLQIIPGDESLTALENDYTAMLEDGPLAPNQPSLGEIIAQWRAIPDEAIRQAAPYGAVRVGGAGSNARHG